MTQRPWYYWLFKFAMIAVAAIALAYGCKRYISYEDERCGMQGNLARYENSLQENSLHASRMVSYAQQDLRAAKKQLEEGRKLGRPSDQIDELEEEVSLAHNELDTQKEWAREIEDERGRIVGAYDKKYPHDGLVQISVFLGFVAACFLLYFFASTVKGLLVQLAGKTTEGSEEEILEVDEKTVRSVG